MKDGRPRIALGAFVALALVLVGATGCQNSEEKDPTPVRTFKITPAAQPRTSSPAAAPTAPATPGAGGAAVDIVGQDSKFTVTDVTAAAGAVTVRFDNRDPGVVHNLHVFRGANAQGESLGQTALAAGPVQQELTLNLAAGSYFFRCDAHPTTMKATLTVR